MDINTLAERISAKLNITTEAAQEAAETHLQQFEALEQRDIARDDIFPDDANFIEEAVYRAQRAGDMGHREEALLDEALAEYRRAEENLETATQQRDEAIRTALAAGSKVANIIRQTGLSRGRIDQIRKRTR